MIVIEITIPARKKELLTKTAFVLPVAPIVPV
jgi:hypothetical protein